MCVPRGLSSKQIIFFASLWPMGSNITTISFLLTTIFLHELHFKSCLNNTVKTGKDKEDNLGQNDRTVVRVLALYVTDLGSILDAPYGPKHHEALPRVI